MPAKASKSPQSSPISASNKQVKKSKTTKTAQIDTASMSKGRRSTMNSRDAVFAEEQLRRAIEVSKQDGEPGSSATGIRKGKRSRSESEESVLSLL